MYQGNLFSGNVFLTGMLLPATISHGQSPRINAGISEANVFLLPVNKEAGCKFTGSTSQNIL